MYVYQMNWPIDEFGLMVKFKRHYERCCEEEKKDEEEYEDYWESPYRLRSILRRALRCLAEYETYWEGDIRGNELYIGSLPHDEGTSSLYYIALKQDNNGSSFIISEFPFAHLEEFFIEKKINKPVIQSIQNSVKDILNRFAPSNYDEEGFVFTP